MSLLRQLSARTTRAVVARATTGAPRLATLVHPIRALHTQTLVKQQDTTTQRTEESSTSGKREDDQHAGSEQQEQGTTTMSSGGGGGGGQHVRRGHGRRRGGTMARSRNIGDEFDLFRNQINRMMSDFDAGLFGGRGVGGGLFGGDRGGLFGDRGLLGGFSPFGGRDFPLLGGGGFGGDRDQGLLLGPGEELEDVTDALALPTSPLDLMRPGTMGAQQLPTIRMDIEEKPDKFEVTADVPGFRKEDLHVRVENGCLIIDAKHQEEKKRDDPNRRFLRTERVVQSARRVIRLGNDADQTPGKVKARYADGILKIDLPKVEESQRSGHVEISAGADTTSQPGTQAS